MEIYHPFHPEHKLGCKKGEKTGDEDGVVCAACQDEIIPSQHYCSCEDCEFFLHQLCAERPMELTHSSHPLHPLRLLQKTPYQGSARCNGCGKRVEGFIYHCAICKYDLDFICAFPAGSKMNQICHPAHTLSYEKIVRRADKGVVCALCENQISGPLSNFYSCRKCKFFLHQFCFERPHELTSPLHPQHPLTLTLTLNHADTIFLFGFCNRCQKPPKDLVYHCHTCKFNLHFSCAFPRPQNRVQSFGNVHNHPLRLITTPAKFSCSICSSEGDDEEDQSYICSIPTCDFWIHRMCTFATLTQRYKDHHHPLSLIQGVPEDLNIYRGIYCYVCRKTISPKDWVSHCARCTFFVHVMCMTTDGEFLNSTKDDVDYLDDSFIKLLLNGDEFVDWPLKDISSELIKPFLLGKNSIVDVQPKIRHLSHMQHDMILFQELHVNNDSFFEEEDEEIICDGCIHPITAPYYCCQECNYYLHLACANLPPKIKHFSHPHHDLVIGYQDNFWKHFKCSRCEKQSNGFNYLCKICDFSLDLTCAALPAMIMHETHQHPLRQTQYTKNDRACYACGHSMLYGVTIFKCMHCDILIHFDCAFLCRSIRHRWDRQHPIDLKFPPHDRPRGHFMCDMCEEYIHPLYWLYSCFECEISFHSRCIPRYTSFNINIKYGGKVYINSHPHPLKYLSTPTLKITCDKCATYFCWESVFECETCYDCICTKCVLDELA